MTRLDDVRHLLSEPAPAFRGFNHSYDEAKYVVIGFPYDSTSSYRPGARFGPSAIRAASAEIEQISLLTGVNVDKIKIYDAGDVVTIMGDTARSLARLTEVVRAVLADGKIPLCLGGEHTLTIGALSALGRGPLAVVFDAHLDLFDEWPPGVRLSHATVCRRLVELLESECVVIVGARACNEEELDFARVSRMKIIPADAEDAAEELGKHVRGRQVYLSVDLDVLDPSIMPGVGNPEPGGLTYRELLELIRTVFRSADRVLGMDVVELNPLVDPYGTSACVAARLAYDIIALAERRQSASRP